MQILVGLPPCGHTNGDLGKCDNIPQVIVVVGRFGVQSETDVGRVGGSVG